MVLGDGYAVFEVVGYAVDGEGAGFFEEAHGGAGDCWDGVFLLAGVFCVLLLVAFL